MYKRTNGYILICLLVLTGLASQVYNPTLDRKERRLLVSQLKETRTDLANTVKGLSAAQLSFTPAPGKWSIQQCVNHIALSEEALWSMAESALRQPADPSKRSAIKMTDDELIRFMQNRDMKLEAPQDLRPQQAQWKTTEEALEAFKDSRQKHIQFAKTTTQDLRNHIIQGAFGTFDSYQMMLITAVHSGRHIQQIKEIRAHPSFPKQ